MALPNWFIDGDGRCAFTRIILSGLVNAFRTVRGGILKGYCNGLQQLIRSPVRTWGTQHCLCLK